MSTRRDVSKTTRNNRYNRKQMSGGNHPVDEAIRAFLRGYKLNEKQIAKRIGRSQGWLNKYLRGRGKATLDDVIRLVAIVVLGVDAAVPLRPAKRRLLETWDLLSPSERRQLRGFLAVVLKNHDARPSKSTAPSLQKNSGTSGKASGTRPRE